MKILVILLVLTICSTTLAQSKDGRTPKRKVKPLKGHQKFPSPFAGPSGEGHPGIRTPRIPYVDEETGDNRISIVQPDRRYKDVQKVRQVGIDKHGAHGGVDHQGRHSEVDQHGRHSEADQHGRHSGVDQRGRYSGMILIDKRGRHVGNDQQGRHSEVDQHSRHVGKDQHGRHSEADQHGRHSVVDQRGHHSGMILVDQRGRHVGADQQGHHSGVHPHGRHVAVDQQGRHVEVDQQGRHVDQYSRHAGVEQDGRHANVKQRGRQTRQSHNTFLAVHVPSLGGFPGGTQGSSAFLQDSPSPFPGGSHAGNRPGNQGGVVIPDGVVFLGPGGSHGGSGGFRPDPLGSIVINGNFPFHPDHPTGGSPGTSSAGGPGGSTSGSDSGLAGGLGGVYGAGYGFGLGGLLFGGPNGPVFAGNAALGEGFSGSPEGAVANDEFEDPDKQNAVQRPRIPAFRPLPSRGNLLEAEKAKVSNQANRGVQGTYPKNQNPNQYPNGGRSLSPTSSGGETVGYVAFIFPKRHLQKQNLKALESSIHASTVKAATDAAISKTKAIASAAHVTNKPAPTLLPVPVHIPVDRPYPVLVPKPYPVEVLKPYPVAVPIREPVPYEVTRPILVPLARPAEVARPAESPFLAGFNGVGSVVLESSLETSILHKRSDKIDSQKPA